MVKIAIMVKIAAFRRRRARRWRAAAIPLPLACGFLRSSAFSAAASRGIIIIIIIIINIIIVIIIIILCNILIFRMRSAQGGSMSCNIRYILVIL